MILECKLICKVSIQIFNLDSFLFHGITVTDGNAVIALNGLEVYCDAERCTDLILAAIALADRTGLVIVDREVLCQNRIDLMCLFAQFLGQRQDSSLIRCQSRVEVHYHTGVVLLSVHNFFVIRLGNDGQEQTLYAQGRLDNVRDVLGVGLRVEVFQRLAAVFLVLILAFAAITVLNINSGNVNISIPEIFRILLRRTGEGKEYNIIWKIRLPRILMAAILGGALSLSGFLLQTFFENPIAGPFVLGIS